MIIQSEAEWLENRKNYVTASEASVLFGLNPFSSPRKVVEEKKESTFFGNSYTYIGQLLEEVVIKVTNDQMKMDFELCEGLGGKLFETHDQVRLGATPDAMNKTAYLECKTTRNANILKWNSFPPYYYLMQLYVQMMCGNKDEGYLACLGTDLSQSSPKLELPFIVFKLTRHDQIDNMIKSEVNRFWDLTKQEKLYRINSEYKRIIKLLLIINLEKII
jgi:putative phage-type endonuclease